MKIHPLIVAACATFVFWTTDCVAKELVTIPVTVHMLSDDEGAAAGAEEVDRWLTKASELMADAGVTFRAASLKTETMDSAIVPSVAVRNQLVSRAKFDGTIHLYVARKVSDIDKEGGWIAGVHWRYWGSKKSMKGQHCVILSASACGVETLAHEFGHFFGEPHTKAPDNIMCSPGRRAGATFSAAQITRIKADLAARLRSGELRSSPAEKTDPTQPKPPADGKKQTSEDKGHKLDLSDREDIQASFVKLKPMVAKLTLENACRL